MLTKADNLNNNLSYCCVNPISTFRRPNSVFWALPKPNNRQKTGANSGNQSFPELAPVCFQEALDHSARAGSERFFPSRRFRKRWNPVWISRFWNRTDGGKDPLPSRRRIIQRFPNRGSAANWCLSLCSRIPVIARSVRLSGQHVFGKHQFVRVWKEMEVHL